MDELEIQGKKYISSKRAAELTGYAKDYIGQLARGGKIPGTRVGRAWYVEESALLALAGSQSAVFGEASDVRPEVGVLQGSTLYSIHALSHKSRQDVFGTWHSLSYLEDKEPLIPPLITLLPEIEVAIKPRISATAPGTHVLRSMHVQKRAGQLSADGIVVARPMQDSLRPSPHGQTFSVYVLGSTGLLLLLAVWIGSWFPSEWSFATPRALTASVEDAGSVGLGVYFQELFTAGIDLINGFLGSLMASFGSFFTSGLIFILNLLHLG